jgi:hypothetical protein
MMTTNGECLGINEKGATTTESTTGPAAGERQPNDTGPSGALRAEIARAGMPYPTFGDDWRKRWVQLGNSSTLHRVASTMTPTEEEVQAHRADLRRMGIRNWKITKFDDWEVDGLCPVGIEGITACGLSGRLGMPGLFSRMDAPRCKRCCKKVGIPYGNGAPFNDKSLTEEQRSV